MTPTLSFLPPPSVRGAAPLVDIVEVERALLGALMIDNRTATSPKVELTPDHFSSDRHKVIWRAALDMIGEGQQANPVTLRRFLSDDRGVVDMCHDLADMAVGAAPRHFVDLYATQIVRSFVRRLVVELSDDIDRLLVAVPENITGQTLGAYTLVRCADIATRAIPPFAGKSLSSEALVEFQSVLLWLVDMVGTGNLEDLS